MPHSRTPSNDYNQRSQQKSSAEQSGHGLRAHLQHLIPKHALFHVRIQVHQVSSVPLVHGQFGARWKFRRVKSSAGTTVDLNRLHKAKRDAQNAFPSASVTGRQVGNGDAIVADENGVSPPQSGESSLASSFVSVSSSQIPSVVVSPSPGVTPYPPPFISSKHSSSSHDSSSSYQTSSTTSSDSNESHIHSSTPITPSTPTFAVPQPNTSRMYSPSRGITPYYKLKDHAVTWEHSLDVLVKMEIDRETSELLSSICKISILQRVIAGDPDAPQNPRLGAVYLDLAQYAGVGDSVTRRYLLRKSKTNATLKLTTQVTFVSGESHYIAPTLPKGEIMNGVAGLLNSDIYRTRPRGLELWGPYYNKQELELDLLGGASVPDPDTKHKQRPRSRSRRPSTPHHPRGHDEEEGSTGSDTESEEERYEVPFDVSRLPLAYGPKTTEVLIESLFNPIHVVKEKGTFEKEKEKESPFELYVKEEEEEARKQERRRRRWARHERERTIGPSSSNGTGEGDSVYSVESNGQQSVGGHSTKGSTSTGSIDEPDEPKGKPMKGWWARKVTASRPSTPQTTAVK